MSDSWRLRKLDPGLVAMYSMPSDLITSSMKSEPGRSITMSPGCGFTFSLLPSTGFSASAARAGWVRAMVAAVAPALAAADFRNIRRSSLEGWSCSSMRVLRLEWAAFLLLESSGALQDGTVFHTRERPSCRFPDDRSPSAQGGPSLSGAQSPREPASLWWR